MTRQDSAPPDPAAGPVQRLSNELGAIRDEALARLAAATGPADVEAVRHEVFGRSRGSLTVLLGRMRELSEDDRPRFGALANDVRRLLADAISARLEELSHAALEQRLAAELLDMSAPGRPLRAGHLHPLQIVERDIREFFHAYGFEVVEGPEIETDEYNFELLNIPPDHPARDLWDTLYVAAPGGGEATRRPDPDGTILRTHTSALQIRTMRSMPPPIRVLIPGRCFRYEAVDASHGSEFYQVEGLVVDRESSLADLKGILEEFARAIFGGETRTRFRPGYYPFTEPSVAFDIGCLVCGGDGCPSCKRTGWMTILGAGMVHPVVLRNGGLDPDEFQGYAFGMGIDRIAILRYGVTDIRLFFTGDLRFLEQFAGGR